ncbi:MAG TPA: twin-arginine translocation signal domain-containing protein, partial [Desulfitobacterium dehalogenans]|nr:twin-arginine translocation signal domain-containing protein [Desulfitobacterium dehalogenans]
MTKFFDKINEMTISRRNFIKASTAAAASLSLVGCGNTLTTTNAGQIAEKEGKWITAACW